MRQFVQIRNRREVEHYVSQLDIAVQYLHALQILHAFDELANDDSRFFLAQVAPLIHEALQV